MNKFLTSAVAAIALLGGMTLPSFAQTQMQFPTTPWGGFAPASIQCGSLIGANMNVTTDQVIPISIPSNSYVIDSIEITNPSVSLTTAAGGFYSAASKGGVAVVAATQAYSGLTTNVASTTGNALKATLATAGNTTSLTGALYFSLTTGQGAAATADIRVKCSPLY